MEYLLKSCSGAWCPAYYGPEDAAARLDKEPKVYKVNQLISIPLDHPDLQSLYRRQYKRPPKRGQFRIRVVDNRSALRNNRTNLCVSVA